jgi:hypothetical protein
MGVGAVSMVLGKTKKRIALLLMVTVMSVFVSGCGGGEEEETTPQRFVYDFEAKAAMAAARHPEAVSEREIPVGTMFPVRLLNRISSAHARVGDVFQIQVLQDVVVDGAVVIPVGSIGQGRVTEANAAGGWGKGGKLRIALDYVMSIDGQPIPIEANEQTAGRDQEVMATHDAKLLPYATTVYEMSDGYLKEYVQVELAGSSRI